MEMCNPIVKAFHNLWQMDAHEIANFGPLCPSRLGKSFIVPDDLDDYLSVDSSMADRKPHSPNRYFYKIGKYVTSMFY